jgi:hypothetical protein
MPKVWCAPGIWMPAKKSCMYFLKLGQPPLVPSNGTGMIFDSMTCLVGLANPSSAIIFGAAGSI